MQRLRHTKVFPFKAMAFNLSREPTTIYGYKLLFKLIWTGTLAQTVRGIGYPHNILFYMLFLYRRFWALLPDTRRLFFRGSNPCFTALLSRGY